MPIDFDLRILNGAGPLFLGNVLRDGECLCQVDIETRVRFETQALSCWLDFRPVWERVRSEVLARWAHG